VSQANCWRPASRQSPPPEPRGPSQGFDNHVLAVGVAGFLVGPPLLGVNPDFERSPYGGSRRELCSPSPVLPALTSPLHRPRSSPSPRQLRWERNGNTRAVHERSRPIPADPARSLMTWANGSTEPINWTVVAADTGLQNQRAACRVAGGFDSRPPPPLEPTSDEGATVPAGQSRQSVMLDLVVSVQHACLVDELQRPPSVTR
jgi:hypothetical protein